MDVKAALLWLVTGQRGAGKTAFCRALIAHARSQGWNAAGLLSPAVFEGQLKTGILVEDVRSGETRPLASSMPQESFDLQLGDWYFNRSSLVWGSHILKSSLPCDLLIVDELGLLELKQHKGWWSALNILRRDLGCDQYRLALVVIRPELQETAYSLFAFSKTLVIDRTWHVEQWGQIYWPDIMAVW